MAEARAAVNTLRVGAISLEQVTTAAKLRGVQVSSKSFDIHRNYILGLILRVPTGTWRRRRNPHRHSVG